ncbi:hypothetical protein [Natronomonas amylolytica]|uniref:hypothetical protein n=1 Tax=Natronomonas amylolytica TaxID=3108498 RepID=UPI00300905BC
MVSKPRMQCPLCNERLERDADIEEHLLSQHEPRELASEIASEWEAEEFAGTE